MARKKGGLGGVTGTLFGEIAPYGRVQEEGPSLLPLVEIRPDPGQPRRLLPADLAGAVANGELTPDLAIREWMERAEAEETDPASKRSARELRRLAVSIEAHGLINPITVRRPREDEELPADVKYLVVTGERRYWAHVLLMVEGRHIQEGDEVQEPDRIKATIAPEGISVRAHQLIENLMREDINAVEKARGLWALRYELSGVAHGSPLPTDDADGNEVEVTHGSPSLVPWGKVQEALGISKRHRIRITSVLDLCREAQALVAEHNLSERAIRPIVQKLKDRPDLQVEALKQLVAWQQENEGDEGAGRPLVASVRELVDQLLAREVEAASAEEAVARAAQVVTRPPGARQFRSKIRSSLRFLDRLEENDLAALTHDLATAEEYADVVDDLRNLRERIDAILEAVEGYEAGGVTRRPLGE